MSEDNPSAPTAGPVVTIRYCVDCKWLLRAQWYAGELLQTFADDLAGVLIVPAHGAMFRIEVGGGSDGTTTVWNRKTDGGFPEIADLKRRVRDLVAPDKALGHVDRSSTGSSGRH
ncbi:SelT/SelW/SelH family protein [Nocardioides sp. GY 10113]|uniref:SelT/SelW/SelH family protein n=1 Tax=Nocardioides sp. GY 10113 TaxID=2569761 RepID=UPI0010A7CD02|nr:SelT/SelW/SelH family protein [Nocardioides sp. GY 10113]TIC85100.1 SelT/SelW/SelH family protein [Nocardioides sp. GY 10113]